MLIKALNKLQPIIQEVQSIILEDGRGNAVYVAAQVGGAIVAAQAGDSDFDALLRASGADKMTIVNNFTPKSADEMKRLL